MLGNLSKFTNQTIEYLTTTSIESHFTYTENYLNHIARLKNGGKGHNSEIES